MTTTIQTSCLDTATKEPLTVIASTIRCLSIDAVEKAGSGHAGTPMGCAEIAAYLYGSFLRYTPHNLEFPNRDRFVLSAGHASMLQYSCLHLSGSRLSLDDLKQFRQLNSKTPSHPQYRLTPGIETTTGVDGQGISHGIGQALGLKLLGARFNKDSLSLFDAKVVILAGDGCFMEGISHEASSLAGHLNLNNIIIIYDRNKTCLDGFVSESCSEDTRQRYLAYGWDVYEIDGHDFDALHDVLGPLRERQDRPVLIIADTTIGRGAATQAGSYFIHSEPLEEQERKTTKQSLGFPDIDFYVPQEAYDFFKERSEWGALNEKVWDETFQTWAQQYPELFEEYQKMASRWLPDNIEDQLFNIDIPEKVSGRKASSLVLNFLGDLLPGLYGGSADLARSDMTHMHQHSVITASDLLGKNIKYGVREFGMGGIAIGLAQTKMITPFIGTFLGFSDYMLSSIRMAALMRVKVIYQFTHDSIFIGQDGPTHQPIEQLCHLRSIPNLLVIRPADANEVKMAWLAALKYDGPTAIVLSRQETSQVTQKQTYAESLGRGAYVAREGKRSPLDYTLIATGSEVEISLQVAEELEKKGYSCRVVSMPCWKLFDEQSDEYKESLLGKNSGKRVSIEAASEMGWHKYVLGGIVIGLNTFGKSATKEDLAREFGFTPQQIIERIST